MSIQDITNPAEHCTWLHNNPPFLTEVLTNVLRHAQALQHGGQVRLCRRGLRGPAASGRDTLAEATCGQSGRGALVAEGCGKD